MSKRCSSSGSKTDRIIDRWSSLSALNGLRRAGGDVSLPFSLMVVVMSLSFWEFGRARATSKIPQSPSPSHVNVWWRAVPIKLTCSSTIAKLALRVAVVALFGLASLSSGAAWAADVPSYARPSSEHSPLLPV